MVQLFRLAHAGIEFFRSGKFPTNIKAYDENLWKYLLDIKLSPGNHSPNKLVNDIIALEEDLKSAYNESSIKFQFDVDYANWVCHYFYTPYLIQNFPIQNSHHEIRSH